MERVIEKFKEAEGAERIIADYLIDFAKEDPKFIDKLLSEKKTIEECLSYINAKAKDQAEGNVAMIEDKTVFGWAIHYFDEENLEDWKKVSAKVTTTKTKKVAKEQPEDEESDESLGEEPKQVIKNVKANKSSHEGQLSLFGELL